MTAKLAKGVVSGAFMTFDPESHVTEPVDRLKLDFDGIIGEARAKRRGRIMVADARTKGYRKKEDTVLHRQQVSVIDLGSLAHIATELGIDRGRTDNETPEDLVAKAIGVNLVVDEFEGTDTIPTFHSLPNSTDFGPVDEENYFTSSVTITRYNNPCVPGAGRALEAIAPTAYPRMAGDFVSVAKETRGYVGMVVLEGEMAVGDELIFRPMTISPSLVD